MIRTNKVGVGSTLIDLASGVHGICVTRDTLNQAAFPLIATVIETGEDFLIREGVFYQFAKQVTIRARSLDGSSGTVYVDRASSLHDFMNAGATESTSEDVFLITSLPVSVEIRRPREAKALSIHYHLDTGFGSVNCNIFPSIGGYETQALQFVMGAGGTERLGAIWGLDIPSGTLANANNTILIGGLPPAKARLHLAIASGSLNALRLRVAWQ